MSYLIPLRKSIPVSTQNLSAHILKKEANGSLLIIILGRKKLLMWSPKKPCNMTSLLWRKGDISTLG
jgi:hypothetical protein